MRITEDYIVFLNGIYNNSHPCEINYAGMKFTSAEDMFLFMKSIYFHREDLLYKLFKSSSAEGSKSVFEELKQLTNSNWEDIRHSFMRMVIYTKFMSDPKLKEDMLSDKYEGKHFVYADPFDTIWGIGLSEADQRVEDRSCWKGKNLLGKALDEVRELIKREVVV